MLPIAYYLLKVIICSGILYGYYWLSLRNKVFHKYNRFYLMAAVLLSMLLPLIKIDFWQQQAQQQSGVIRVLQAVSSGDEYMDNITVTTGSNSFDMEQLYPFAYMLVSFILLLVFLHTLFIIFSLLKKYPKQTIDKVAFINTDAKSTPFSFLNYIFWNYNIDLETTTGNQIFKHELAHVQEGHTYDKLFINIVLIFFWCNPFYWLYRKELNMIHEFIADKKAVEDNDTEAFAAMILQATYPQHRFQLTNNFFYSPIKRRLLMLTKNKNPKVNYLGRIMVLPLLILIFAAFTFKIKARLEAATSGYKGKKITVIIDAAGGGDNLRWKSATGIWEKDINLSIAQKIKLLNSNENIQIVLSRNSDINISSEYNNIAVRNNADLVITISMAQNVHNSNERGWDVCIPYDSAKYFQQSKLMGSILFSNFSDNYGLPPYQNSLLKRAWVRTTDQCPSIMIQPGHITSLTDFTYFNNPDNQEKIANNILKSIEKFAAINMQNNQSNESTTAAANYFMNNLALKPSFRDSTRKSMFINVKNADTNYFKSNEYKTKALIIVDDKEIGNFGYNYIEKSNLNYSSIVIYGPKQAAAIYGTKGKYGVMKLTVENAMCITADSIFYDDKKQTIKLSGTNSSIKGNLDKTLIYVDGKEITPLQLNEIKPDKISSINILKGEKLDEIVDAKGKTSVISVTLKPTNLAEVIVTGKQSDPVYVIDNKVQATGYELNAIKPENIERVDVLKDNAAITKYGEQAVNGVIEITTKNNISKFNSPILSIGNLLSHTVSVEDFKKQTQLNVSDGYSFVSATVYFGGKGFPQPAVASLNGSSLEPLKGYIEKCVDGSAVVFENVKVKKDGIGTITIDGHAFNFADGKELSNLPTDQQWATAAGQKYITNGLDEVVVTGYQSKRYADSLAGIQIDRVFTKVEKEPYYPGGSEAWKNYLMKNLDPRIPVREGWKAGTYTVIVQFIVHSDGTVSDVTTTNYQGSKTAQHCIDLVKRSATWLPAIQNGRAVNAYRKQPITFVIEADKKDITEVYSVPFKVHLMSEGKINTYHILSNGKFTAKFKAPFYVNGKLSSDPGNINRGATTAIESYDEDAGKLSFGDKGKYGVTLITTKG